MTKEFAAQRLKIVSGLLPEMETELNGLLDEWAVVVWEFMPVGDAIRGVAVLLHVSVLRQQAIANTAGGAREIGGFPYARR